MPPIVGSRQDTGKALVAGADLQTPACRGWRKMAGLVANQVTKATKYETSFFSMLMLTRSQKKSALLKKKHFFCLWYDKKSYFCPEITIKVCECITIKQEKQRKKED